MLIKVKTLTGKEIEIDIEPTDKVERIKERVEEKEGIPPQQQRLIFSGKQMNDEKTAQDYKDLYYITNYENMSRYSSDSESSAYHHKSRRKRRSSSSSSSSSSKHKRSKSSKYRLSCKYKKSKSYSSQSYRKSRSRSKNSSRHSRSASKDRRRRSHSKEKYKTKHYYKSHSHSKGYCSKYHSRSSSSDSKTSSSSSSSSKSFSNNSKTNVSNKKSIPPNVNSDEQLREKLLKAIKAAESADHLLKEQGVLPKSIKSRNDINSLNPGKPQVDVLKEINAEEFIQKSFVSSKEQKEIIPDDLNIPVSSEISSAADLDRNSIFHASFFIDQKSKLDRWVKKLYQIRQKAVLGESGS